MKKSIKCNLFDGNNLLLNKIITIENDTIISIEDNKENNSTNYLMTPPLIDAHTHMTDLSQINKMLNYGINMTFDVCATKELVDNSKDLIIISSYDMAMGIILNPKGIVENAIKKNAKYIKVLLFNSLSIGFKALKKIVDIAHKNNLKVVVHATELTTYKQAIEANADIILHLPMKEEITDELAKEIYEKNIYIVPTLVMMKAFSNSGRNGYKQEHFNNALKEVKTLYDNNANILVGTDSNIGSFSPKVEYGESMYTEIELLREAGLPLIDILKGATANIGKAFNLDVGKIEIGKKADFLLFKSNDISYDNLENIYINGKVIK